MKISQIDLLSDIMRSLAKQGVKDSSPRIVNACIKAANTIIEEVERPERKAVPGMGLAAWLASDDTGMSSKFMAHVLCGAGLSFADIQAASYPHDPSDLGRCLRFLEAVPEVKERLDKMSKHGPVWRALVKNWDKLEAVYREEFPSGHAPKCYAMMSELIEKARKEDDNG